MIGKPGYGDGDHEWNGYVKDLTPERGWFDVGELHSRKMENVKSIADSSGKYETGVAQKTPDVSIEACRGSRDQNHKRSGLERFYQH